VRPGLKKIMVRDGARELECLVFDTPLSPGVFREVLTGRPYPHVPFVGDVRSILDIGANIGAAAIRFALRYREATIHAIEPCREAFELLEHNTRHFPNVRTHSIGLWREDARVPLYHSGTDSMTASVGRSAWNTDESELVEMRRADRWVAEQGLERIDVLKLDTEGCEVAILESLATWLPATRIVYVEYHSEEDRMRIDEMLYPTHILVAGHVIHAHRGEFSYVARSAFPAGEDPDLQKIVVSI
jgi:FkbM family methyltransferase